MKSICTDLTHLAKQLGLQTAFRPNGGLMLVVLRTGSKVHSSDNFITVCRKWLGLAASPSPNFMARKAWESQTWPQRSGPAHVQSCPQTRRSRLILSELPSHKVFMLCLLIFMPLLHLSETLLCLSLATKTEAQAWLSHPPAH